MLWIFVLLQHNKSLYTSYTDQSGNISFLVRHFTASWKIQTITVDLCIVYMPINVYMVGNLVSVVSSLKLHTKQRSSKYKFDSIWFDQTRDQTDNLPHSRRACSLHHQCSCITEICRVSVSFIVHLRTFPYPAHSKGDSNAGDSNDW